MGSEKEKRDGHLRVYVGWPLAGGFMLASVLAICVGGLRLLNGAEWEEATQAAGKWFFAVLGASTVGIFLYAMFGWAGPRRIERMRQEIVVEQPPPPQPVKEWVIRNPSSLLPHRTITTATEASICSIEPEADPEIRELYEFITRVWPAGSVSRETCRELGFGRATWERLVGGQRGKAGQESGRGLLDRAGVVYQDRSGSWQIGVSLEQALSIHPALAAYARQRAELVKL